MMNAVMRATMTRIGFTAAGAIAIVDDQGLDTLAEIQLLTDDEIESLCRVVRRPGGMVPGVGAGAAAVQNPGVQVNQHAEGHLKLMAFYLRHQARVSRVATPPDITLDSIRTVRELREFESRPTRFRLIPAYRPSMPRIGQRRWKRLRNTFALISESARFG